MGVRGLCETWMFRKSPHGWVYGAPRTPMPAGPSQANSQTKASPLYRFQRDKPTSESSLISRMFRAPVSVIATRISFAIRSSRLATPASP